MSREQADRQMVMATVNALLAAAPVVTSVAGALRVGKASVAVTEAGEAASAGRAGAGGLRSARTAGSVNVGGVQAPTKVTTAGPVTGLLKPGELAPTLQGEALRLRINALQKIIDEANKGSDVHRAARWELYQLEDKTWSYERWLKTYEANIGKADKSNAGVTAYQKLLGWGETEVTVQAGTMTRRLDIADVARRRGIEIKEYETGYITAEKEIVSEVARDKLLVEDDWEITWVFIKTRASKPLLDLLKKAGIKVKYE